ncbi:MAG: hypothetical protein CMM07_15620 [Rhodopirellula sp.]|nr:hypothetical protein [Rhodopirellula sp.]
MLGLTTGGNEFLAWRSVEANQRAQRPAMIMLILTTPGRTGQHSSSGQVVESCDGILWSPRNLNCGFNRFSTECLRICAPIPA